MQWRRVDSCVADGHCSAPLDKIGSCGVALYHNGRVMSGPEYDNAVGIVDAVSGVTLSDKLLDLLFVDTSGALLWRGVDNTIADNAIVVSSGPHSTGRTLASGKGKGAVTHFRYGVVVGLTECQLLRFDIDPAPAVESDSNACVGALIP